MLKIPKNTCMYKKKKLRPRLKRLKLRCWCVCVCRIEEQMTERKGWQ